MNKCLALSLLFGFTILSSTSGYDQREKRSPQITWSMQSEDSTAESSNKYWDSTFSYYKGLKQEKYGDLDFRTRSALPYNELQLSAGDQKLKNYNKKSLLTYDGFNEFSASIPHGDSLPRKSHNDHSFLPSSHRDYDPPPPPPHHDDHHAPPPPPYKSHDSPPPPHHHYRGYYPPPPPPYHDYDRSPPPPLHYDDRRPPPPPPRVDYDRPPPPPPPPDHGHRRPPPSPLSRDYNHRSPKYSDRESGKFSDDFPHDDRHTRQSSFYDDFPNYDQRGPPDRYRDNRPPPEPWYDHRRSTDRGYDYQDPPDYRYQDRDPPHHGYDDRRYDEPGPPFDRRPPPRDHPPPPRDRPPPPRDYGPPPYDHPPPPRDDRPPPRGDPPPPRDDPRPDSPRASYEPPLKPETRSSFQDDRPYTFGKQNPNSPANPIRSERQPQSNNNQNYYNATTPREKNNVNLQKDEATQIDIRLSDDADTPSKIQVPTQNTPMNAEEPRNAFTDYTTSYTKVTYPYFVQAQPVTPVA